MQKHFLLMLFFILFAAQSFAIELSLAPGLSIKNLYLYAMLATLAMNAARAQAQLNYNTTQKFGSEGQESTSLRGLHIAYSVFAFYALLSMLVVIGMFMDKDYDALTSVMTFKSNLLDRYLFFLVFFFGLTSFKDAVWLIKAILVIFILGNSITLMDALDMPDLGIIHQRDDGRVSGPMGESNQYGAFLVMFLPLSAYIVFVTRGFQRLFFGFGFLMSFGVLLLAASRGAMVGLTLALLIITALEWKHISKKYFFPATVGLFVVGALIIVIVASQSEGLLTERFLDSSGGYGSSARSISSGRTEIWSAAIAKMNNSPLSFLFGYGWFSWGAADDMARLYENATKYNMAPHNSYLAYFFELGLIGLSLFLSVVLIIINYVRKALNYANNVAKGIILAFLYGFVALLIAIVFVDLYLPWVYVWSLIGVVVRVAYEMLKQESIDPAVEDQPDIEANASSPQESESTRKITPPGFQTF